MRVMTLGRLGGLRGPDDLLTDPAVSVTYTPEPLEVKIRNAIDPIVPLRRRIVGPLGASASIPDGGENFWRIDRPRAYVAAGILGLAAYGATQLLRRWR